MLILLCCMYSMEAKKNATPYWPFKKHIMEAFFAKEGLGSRASKFLGAAAPKNSIIHFYDTVSSYVCMYVLSCVCMYCKSFYKLYILQIYL